MSFCRSLGKRSTLAYFSGSKASNSVYSMRMISELSLLTIRPVFLSYSVGTVKRPLYSGSTLK